MAWIRMKSKKEKIAWALDRGEDGEERQKEGNEGKIEAQFF